MKRITVKEVREALPEFMAAVTAMANEEIREGVNIVDESDNKHGLAFCGTMLTSIIVESMAEKAGRPVEDLTVKLARALQESANHLAMGEDQGPL